MAKIIRVCPQQIFLGQMQIVPGRAQRTPGGEASGRRGDRWREGGGPAQPAQAAREIEVLKDGKIAVTAELLEDISPNEKGLVAEMPAEEAVAQPGEPAGKRESERERAVAAGEATAEGAPLVDRAPDLLERAGREPGIGMKKKQNPTAGLRGAEVHLPRAMPFRERNYPATCRLGDAAGFVLAAAVHDHDLG